jgi:hypothetical protein
MENIPEHCAHNKGWGVDADPENEPTYPMKHYTGDDRRRMNYERPPRQTNGIEVLHSNERPGLTAVYGTSSPPSGLSGVIRRFAFRFSEGSFGHWLPLILADRVNMIEGIFDDLRHGFFPNIMAERGWKAEWKYNKKGLAKRALIGALIATAAIVLLSKNKGPKKRQLAASDDDWLHRW